MPTGTVANDVMVITVAVRPRTATITPPAGWTQLQSHQSTNTDAASIRMTTWVRRTISGETGPYTFTLSAGHTGVVGGIASFSGVDTTTAIDVSAGNTTASGFVHQADGVTTTVDGAMLVTSFAFPSATSNWYPPGGMTEDVDVASLARPNTGGVALEVTHELRSAAGATAARAATAESAGTDAGFGVAHILALRPAASWVVQACITADASSCSNDDSFGTFAWSNPARAETQNDSVASSGGGGASGNYTNYLRCTGYGFNVPAGATIDSIEFGVDRYINNANSFRDGRVHIIRAGSVQTGVDASNPGAYPTSDTDTYDWHGGSPAYWTGSWTASDVNNSDFGGALAALKLVSGTRTVYVDHLMARVCYTAALNTLADYRFDECSQYSSGSAGQVEDSTGSYPATPMGGVANATPGKINRYADFSNATRYVEVPSGPTLIDWTVSVWFKMPFATMNHSSQFYVLGSVNARGDLLYLDRDSSGGAYRWGVFDHNGGSSDGSFRFSTLADGWHHMVLVGSGNVTSLYIDGTYRDQVGRKTQGIFRYLGASVDNRGTSNGQSFGAPLDEFKIFGTALSAGQIALLYSNESSGDNWDGTARSNPCTMLDHIRIEHDGEGLTCMPESVTVRACADAICSSEYISGNVTTTLSPAGWVGGDTITFSGGHTTASLAKTTTGPVMLGAGSTIPPPTTATRCFNGATETCAMSFVNAGFIFATAANGSEASVGNQVAGTAFGPYWLRAVKTGTDAKACEAAITSPQTVNFNYVCTDPACSSGSHMTMGASTIGWTSTPVSLTFDANGNASLGDIVFQDVGRITLAANASVGGVTLSGSLTGPGGSPFVVRPDHFDLSGIVCSDATANPAATSASGAKFCKAGEDFNVTVTARSSTGAVTPNYGQEGAAETVKLTHALVGGLGLTQPGSLSGSFGAFTSGVASGNFQWDEVGIITLTPSVGDASYLGAGDVAGTAVAHVGRFYPDHFGITGNVTNRSDLASSGGSFTYMGEPMRLDLTVTAYRKGEGVTTNYQDAFAKLDAAALGTSSQWFNTGCTGSTQCFGLGAVNAATGLSGRLGVVGAGIYTGVLAPTSSWTAGVGTFVVNVRMNRKTLATDWPDPPASVLDGPYDALRFGAMPRDSDGVTLPGPAASDAHKVDLDASTGDTLNSHPDGTHERRWLFDTSVRFGRLRLVPGQGSQYADYLLRTEAQYWNGSAWVTNTQDSLTPLAADNFAITGAGTIIDAGNINQGFGSVRIRPSGTGVADVCLGAGATGTGACAAANPAELDYLLGNWSDADFNDDPAVRMTFGQPHQKSRANWGFIYRRENY